MGRRKHENSKNSMQDNKGLSDFLSPVLIKFTQKIHFILKQVFSNHFRLFGQSSRTDTILHEKLGHRPKTYIPAPFEPSVQWRIDSTLTHPSTDSQLPHTALGLDFC